MAYFECTIGGASGDGVALVVQCDANFAGSTITADNGEDTFTETCPSVSPYTVRFEGIPTGTYTISGVSQGQTFTTQFTVLDYETTLNATPEGATVLPINDIQIWLHCANIWDKNYTTISQVLADTTTLLALVSSNNAADYMVRSTGFATEVCANQTAMGYIGNNDYCADKLLSDSTWGTAICNSAYFESVLNVKVPTMTSDTTPSGTTTASSVIAANFAAWKAFDGTYAGETNAWGGMANAINQWVAYQFTQDVMVKKAELHQRGSDTNLSTKDFKIQASSDGTTWVDLSGTETMPNQTSAGKTLSLTNANSNSKYNRFRLFLLDAGYGTVPGIGELQFYGRA